MLVHVAATPASWPAHIIRNIHAYVIGKGAQNHIRCCLLPQKKRSFASPPPDTNIPCACCFCTSSLKSIAPLLGVCRAWTHIASTVLAKHMCVDLGNPWISTVPTMHSVSPRCFIRKYCSIEAVTQSCLHRAVQGVVIRVPLESIGEGGFVDQWNSCKGSDRMDVFPAVRALSVCVYWPQNIANSEPSTPVDDDKIYEINGTSVAARRNREMINRAVVHLARAFPNVREVELQTGKVRSLVGNTMISALYQGIIAQTVNKSKRAEWYPSIGYCAWNRLIHVDRLPVVHGLTSLTINQLVHGGNSSIRLAVRNARTLEKMDLSIGMSFLCSSLIFDDQQMPVQYPQLKWLRLGVYGGVPFIHRHACSAKTFPQLRHLFLPGVFPFSNSCILDDCASTLETLCLGISDHMYDPFAEQFGLLAPAKYPRLKLLELRTLVADDPYLLPGILNNQMTEPFPDAYYAMAFALGTHAKHIRLAFGSHCQSLKTSALFAALDDYAPNLTCLSVLDLMDGCSTLDVAEIRALASQLPALLHLLCKANVSHVSDKDVSYKLCNGVSKLKELSVLLNSQDPEEVYRFINRLALTLPVLQRVNVRGHSGFVQDAKYINHLPVAIRFRNDADSCLPIDCTKWWSA